MRYSIAILILFVCSYSFAQNKAVALNKPIRERRYVWVYELTPKCKYNDTTLYYFSDTATVYRFHPTYAFLGKQKQAGKQISYVYRDTSSVAGIFEEKRVTATIQKKPLITVHGNIYYDVFYQSNIDTPYYERDIYQHTIRTYLDVTVKDRYPLRINFATRFSNSGMFRDFTGIGLQFNPQQFKQNIITRLQQYAMQQLEKQSGLDSLKAALQNKYAELNRLKNYVAGSNLLQQIIEARERAYVEKIRHGRDSVAGSITGSANELYDSALVKTGMGKKTAKADSLAGNIKDRADSLLHRLEKTYAAKKDQLDSLKATADTLQQRYEKAVARYELIKQQVTAGIAKAKDPAALQKALQTLQVPDSLLPKQYKKLLALRSVGIGRSIVDYSELTAKNITITGFQAEYNPSYYVAIATGMIDYQFRDYIVNTSGRQKQYLNILRIGKGMRDGDHIIASFFQGKKQLYNYAVSATGSSVNTPQPDYHLTGFAIELRKQLDNNNYIIAEAGKSSLPYFRRANKDGLLQSTFRFSDRSNEAYSVKFTSFIPATLTKLSGIYKHTGADYQSFSYYTSNTTQNAWSVKLEQPFFKRKLNVIAALRKNDFSSPYLSNAYQSNTLFKSIQATMHIRKLPVLSVGFFPTSQLIKINDDLYMENLYYTLTGTASHSYRYKGNQMNTLLSYVRFYNKQPDSGFVYFNTRNIMLSQYMYFRKFTLQLQATETISTAYKLYTAGGNIQFNIKEWWQLGGGIKHNNQTVINQQQTGYNINTGITIRKIGTFRFFAEKGFIPGINRQLVENKVGRFTYIKTF